MLPEAKTPPPLRPYQDVAVRTAVTLLTHGVRTILASPTGGGKTRMGEEIIASLGLPTLWMVHTRELVAQAAGAMRLPAGMILAGERPEPDRIVQVASVQTLTRREFPPVDLIVIDEAHRSAAETYTNVLDAYPSAKVLGLTATPFRLDGKGLGCVYQRIVVAGTTAQLCADGTLVEPVVFAPPGPNLAGVKKTAGDFDAGQLAARMNRAELVADIVTTWKKHAAGRRTVCFAVNVDHSMQIAARFRAAGVAAEHLDGGTPKEERKAILARLRTGETTLVSNCQILTEGWDLPALEVAIIARPTASLNLHLQTIGRVMRAADGKAGAIVLDHAGNHHRHGSVTRELEYSLDGEVRFKDGQPEGQGDVKACPECDFVVPRVAKACPECGHVFTAQREIVQVDGELREFRAAQVVAREQRQFYAACEYRRQQLGHQPGWVAHQFKERFGQWPLILDDGRLITKETASKGDKAAVFAHFERVRAQRGFQKGWVAHQYRAIFGVWPRGLAGAA